MKTGLLNKLFIKRKNKRSKSNNKVIYEKGKCNLSCRITGENNEVTIGPCKRKSNLSIRINGNNNKINLTGIAHIKNLSIIIGSQIQANGAILNIGDNLTIGDDCKILLYNTGNICQIGQDCMISSNITIRCGELPHLLFDIESGEYLDKSDGVFIGDHVWIGERTYLMKRARIPNGCIIGCSSIVTKNFEEENCVIAGNPAKIVRENIIWFRDPKQLKKDPRFYQSYQNHIENK